MIRLYLIAIFILMLSPLNLSAAQNYTLKGRVVGSNDEAVAGVNILVKETSRGTYSNAYGEFELKLPLGEYTLSFSSLNHITQHKKVVVNKNTSLGINLKTLDQTLEGITVTAKDKRNNVSSVQMSVSTINAETIAKVPQLMGEVDIVKVIQLMPGVNQASEGSSGYSVRGGTTDQNLILLDGANIYNPSHLMGFFSVFNNDVVKDVTMYRSGFPAEYGGRLSSVLDVTTKTETDKVVTGNLGIGVISSRASVMGQTKDDKFYWSLAGRRSYADIFMVFSPNEQMKDVILYFYDVNAKMEYRPNENNTFTAGGYIGQDRLGMSIMLFGYGNNLAYGSWKHKFSQDLSHDLSFVWTKYNFSMESEMFIDKTTWYSHISSPALNYHFSYFVKGNNKLTFGVNNSYHLLNPGDVSPYEGYEYSLGGYGALESTVFVSDEHTFYNKMALTASLRYNIFSNDSAKASKTYNALDYRLGMVFPISKANSFKLNYEHNNQFIQWASNSTSGSPMNVWFTANANVKPQVSDQYSLGYFHNFADDMYEFSAQVYFKDYRNVIDFADNATILGNADLDSEVLSGKGESYGLELTFEKTKGRLTGFVNYTFSHSEYSIKGINGSKPYISPYDKPHSFNLSLNYEINRKWDVSLLWVYSSGSPISFPESRIVIGDESYNIYYERNTYRMKDYHRLDLSANYTKNPDRERWQGQWNFSIYNTYNRKNAWMYSFDSGTVTSYYLFGIIPSVTYNLKF